MNEYYFLFALAFLYLIFASIQDLKQREVANWLSFSLIAFAFAYRIFYSSYSGNWMFLLYGLVGFAICFALANAFYYARVFAGGDAKLLMGLGLVIPFSNWSNLFLNVFLFVFVLFCVGAVYSLLYSIIIVSKNRSNFSKHFKLYWKKYYYILFIAIPFYVLAEIAFRNANFSIYFGVMALLAAILYIYLKALDVCMIVKVKASNLTEGDWIMNDIRLGKQTIKKTVHGLSLNDIKLLRKYNKSINVKQGIPFVPAFLFTFILMVLFFSILGFDLAKTLASLF